MKSLFKLLITITILCVLTLPAQAIEKAQNSGELTAVTGAGTLHTGRGCVTSIVIATNGSNDAIFNIYDNISAAAPKLYPQITVTATDHIFVLIECIPVAYGAGIHWTLSGTGATATIKYITEN